MGKARSEKNEGQVVCFCAGYDLELKPRAIDLQKKAKGHIRHSYLVEFRLIFLWLDGKEGRVTLCNDME